MRITLVLFFLVLFYLTKSQEWVTCNLYTDDYWASETNETLRIFNKNNHKRVFGKFKPKIFTEKQNFKISSKKTSKIAPKIQRTKPTKFSRKHNGKKDDPYYIPAECTSFSQNLMKGDQRKLYVHSKRLVSETSNKILFLFGGPTGAAASLLDETMDYLYWYLEEEFDVYTIEHRGTGLSNRLGCETSQAETRGSEGGHTITDYELYQCQTDFSLHYPQKGTEGFSVTQAAQDVLDIVKKVRGDKQVYFYGVSYGSYLLNRVLQLNNNTIPISGVALDSVYPTSGNDQERFIIYERDVHVNKVVFKILEECKLDSFCNDMVTSGSSGAIFTENVQTYVEKVFEKAFKNETCIDIMKNDYNATYWKKYMGYLSSIPDGRVVIPAILFRLDRCESFDADVLNYAGSMIDENNNLEPTTISSSSKILERHLIYSELWGIKNVPSYDDLVARFENNLYFGIESHNYLIGSEDWPVFKRDSYFNKTFSTSSPVLILSGKLDPLTPSYFADIMEKQITSPIKFKYEIPYASHWTINTSPVHTNNVSDAHCGFQLLLNFLKNPTQQPDQTCLFNLLEIDWRGNEESNLQYLGVEDLYNGIYEEEIEPRTIDLYLFIAVYTGTCVILLSIIALLIYYVFQLCAKVKDFDEEEEEDEFVEQE